MLKKVKHSLKIFLLSCLRLCRPPIAFLSACSALTGYLLASHRSLLTGILLASGVFLLAAAASALNQYQERDLDARMERTRNRPLPAGALSSSQALSFAFLLAVSGLLLLLLCGGAAFLLGVAALIWYNGLYTPLKRLTPFAAVPGAVVGMIPPAIGWTAAGGALLDPRLFSLCFLFFMWQVPHFWLQLLDHGHEYELAGLPTLGAVLRREQLGRMTFIWISATAVAGLLLPLFGTIRQPMPYFLLLAGGIVIVTKSAGLINGQDQPVKTVFRSVNLYIVLVMSLIASESLFKRMS